MEAKLKLFDQTEKTLQEYIEYTNKNVEMVTCLKEMLNLLIETNSHEIKLEKIDEFIVIKNSKNDDSTELKPLDQVINFIKENPLNKKAC